MFQNFSALKQYLKPFSREIFYTIISLIVGTMSVLSLGMGIKFIINRGISNQDETWLFYAMGVILTGVILMSLTTFTRYYFVYSIAEKLTAKLKSDLYAHLVELNAEFYAKHKSGDILARLTTDMTIIQMVLAMTLPIAGRNILLLMGGMILIFTTSVKLSLLVFGLLPLVIVPIVFFSRKIKKLTLKNQMHIEEQNSHMTEVFNAIPLVKSFQNEHHEKNLSDTITVKILAAARKRIFARALMGGVIIFCVISAIAFVFLVGGMDVIDGTLTPGDLSAFVFYALLVAASMGALSDVSSDLSRASAAMERVFEFLNLDQNEHYIADTMLQKVQKSSALLFENVHFRYSKEHEVPTVEKFSFEIQPKEFVSVVGPSGSGKTTLFQLIMGFYQVDSGQISLFGNSYDALSINAIRSKISYVPQDDFLFSGSIYDNIKYGNAAATKEEVVKVAKMAQAHAFIKKLPDGYQSEIGEKGLKLSGGQKQRIAIARALLKDADIILLDEATSALDNESEHAFYAALDKIRQHKTILLIAHRLSTAEKADKIMVIKDGRIEAFGAKDIIEKASSTYQTLKLMEVND